MKGKIVVTVVVVLAGILLVVYTNAATGGWADTATPTATRVRFVTNTPAKTPAKTRLAPTVVRTATPLIFPTFTPVRIPVLAGTPVPTLTAHVWKSDLIVVKMDGSGGEGGSGLEIHSFPPGLLILSDGQVFTYNKQNQIVTMKLSQSVLCALLNTIDQYGFFDYDAKSYLGDREPPYPSFFTSIEVNAWRTKSIGLPNLYNYAEFQLTGNDNCPGCISPAPTILPALWNTYWFLYHYNPLGLHVYEPERLAVYAVEQREAQPEDRKWPLKSPTLKQLYQKTLIDTGPLEYLGDSVTLTGDTSKTVFKFFDEANADMFNNSLWFSDGKDAYRVLERPLLPYQAPIVKDQYSIVIPDPSISIPPTTLSCSSVDGVLAMPQP